LDLLQKCKIKESVMKKKNERSRGFPALPWAWLAAFILALGIGLLAGCSNNPSAPDDAALTQTGVDPVALEFSTLKHGDFDQCRESSGWVTPWRGGRIGLNWGHPSNRFVVRRGAVDRPVQVRISTCIVPGEERNSIKMIEFEFKPDGLVFDKPALLILNARSLERLQQRYGLGDIFKLYWLNPASGEWEVYQEAISKNGHIIFKIEHFSKFGISR